MVAWREERDEEHHDLDDYHQRLDHQEIRRHISEEREGVRQRDHGKAPEKARKSVRHRFSQVTQENHGSICSTESLVIRPVLIHGVTLVETVSIKGETNRYERTINNPSIERRLDDALLF